MIGKSTVCPSCSGMALLDIEQERIRCIDCGDTFRITGIGQTDREIVCENKYRIEGRN
jgi:hypothetical protein